MIDVLQELVDALAERLQRSVAVDDAGLRLLASSAHFEDVDAARLNSLVGRRVSGAAHDYIMQAGVQNWREPTVLPAHPALGFDRDRLCFPLRSKYELLGFMWLLDDGTLTSSEVTEAREIAERVQDLLALKSQSEADAEIEMEAVVLALLAGDPAARRQAAEDLRNLGLFRRAEEFFVVAVQAKPASHGPSETTVRDAVRRALIQAMQGHPRDAFASAVGSTTSLLIVGRRVPPSYAQRVGPARAVREAIERSAPEVAAVSTVGTSQVVNQLCRIYEAFDQASRACHVAAASGSSTAVWDDHPLEALLSSWLQPQLPLHLVPNVIEELMRQPAGTIEVVEAFLDAGSNVATIADAMHLHRTTVYHRLSRLKEAGIDLNDGSTRLLVHLWLKGRRFLREPDRS